MTLQINVIILLISPYLKPKPNQFIAQIIKYLYLCVQMFFLFYKKLYNFSFLQLFANNLLFSLIFTGFRFILRAQRYKFKMFKTCRSSSRAIITQCTNFHIFKSACNSSRMRCIAIITKALN